MTAQPKKKRLASIHLGAVNAVMCLIAAAAALYLFYITFQSIQSYQEVAGDTDRYIRAQQAAASMQEASDYLTTQARMFTVTGDRQCVENFHTELAVTQRRDRALEDLRQMSVDSVPLAFLERAMQESIALCGVEYHAMRLVLQATGDDPALYPENVTSISLTPEEEALSPQELRAAAQEMVYGKAYQERKAAIIDNVHLCTQSLIDYTRQHQESSAQSLMSLLRRHQWFTAILLAIVLAIVLMTAFLVIQPLRRAIHSIQAEQPMPVTGAYEVRFLAESYNEMFERTRRNQDKLSHQATHDPLTGLYNRKAYDDAYATCDQATVALILADVDEFKSINDTFGHVVGDKVLKRVAELLTSSFRSEDCVCRIGGDEFAVLMMHANSSLSELVRGKMQRINTILQHPTDDLPPVSLSVGVAFSDMERPQGDLFLAADTALYRVKNGGRMGCEIYMGNSPGASAT